LIKGDHRLLGLDFDADILFGSKPTQPSPGIIRGVNSRHEEHVHKFSTRVVNQCNRQHLAKQMAALLEKTYLASNDIAELEQIDKSLTKILLKADQQWRLLSAIPLVTNTETGLPYPSILVPHAHREENRKESFILTAKY